MTDFPQPVDFDARPPMPVAEYPQTVRRVNVGYELLFTLVGCTLGALRRPTLDLLVVGAGGGAEIEWFAPANPGWRLTGVDPSHDMLALARAKTDSLGVGERVTLLQGTVDTLPMDACFDAATCLFVLHFLPDDGKLALLQGIKRRLRSDALLLLASGARPDDGGLRGDLVGAWQQYGEQLSMPADRMAAIIEQVLAQPLAPEETYPRLLREAGFQRTARLFSVLGGGLTAWIAR